MKTHVLKAQREAQRSAAQQARTETIPIRGFTDGRLNMEGHAIAALKSMPKCELADQLDDLEHQYAESLEIRNRYPWGRIAANLTKPATELLRQEIALLAREVNRRMLNDKAQAAQKDFHDNYSRLVAEFSDLRSFLQEHFRDELKRAEALNTPLLQVAKAIMLREGNFK